MSTAFRYGSKGLTKVKEYDEYKVQLRLSNIIFHGELPVSTHAKLL